MRFNVAEGNYGQTFVIKEETRLVGWLIDWLVGWLVVLEFNATSIAKVGDAHVFPGFLTLVHTQLSFESNRLLFSHASAEVRGKNTPERKFVSTGYRTHNHQVMSPTRSPVSPLSYPGGAETRLDVNGPKS